MLGTLNDSTILKLRVKGSELDPLSLRGRVENLLSDVSLQPRLPASATLFIRKLKDPLPGLINLDSSHPRAPEAWRHAFNSRFDQLVSSAARPALGFVDDSVESVVFYDYAELLASLSTDWCRGNVTTRWWWQSLLTSSDVERVIKRLWREQIEYVPAALEYLEKKSALVEFVSRLRDQEVDQLVQQLIRRFALTKLRHVMELLNSQDEFVEELRVESRGTRSIIFSRQFTAAVSAPWRHAVPETVTTELSSSQQLFAGLGLMLHRAPAQVRTVSFASAVENWVEVVKQNASLSDDVPEVSEIDSISVASNQPELVSDEVDVVTVEEKVIAEVSPDVSTTTTPPSTEVVKIGNAVFTHQEVEDEIGAGVIQPVTAKVAVEGDPIHYDEEVGTTDEVSIVESESLNSHTFETELGGLFYLINLGIFLELYNDFTSPVETITELSIWDFVTIAGEEILEQTNHDDPIWLQLSVLAGQETGFHDSPDFMNKNPVNPEAPVNPVPAWLTELLPQIKTRVRQALGITEETDLADILLKHHARVTLTPTHLDVFFLLSELPIEIRLSGLDRDPGWVPAAGKFIAFHYD